MKIGAAVLEIWLFIHLKMAVYGGRHFVNLVTLSISKILIYSILAQISHLKTITALTRMKGMQIILHCNGGYLNLNICEDMASYPTASFWIRSI